MPLSNAIAWMLECTTPTAFKIFPSQHDYKNNLKAAWWKKLQVFAACQWLKDWRLKKQSSEKKNVDLLLTMIAIYATCWNNFAYNSGSTLWMCTFLYSKKKYWERNRTCQRRKEKKLLNLNMLHPQSPWTKDLANQTQRIVINHPSVTI